MLIQSNIVTKGSSSASTSVTGNAVGAFLSTHQPQWQWKALTRDGTAFTAYGTLGTKPTSNVLYESNADAPTLIRVMPFTDTSTITAASVRVVGWSMYLDGASEDWVPTVLADVSLTRSSGTTIKNTISSTDYYPFAGFTATSGTPAPNLYAIGSVGSIVVDALGSQLIQVTCFASSGGMGCLWNTL